MHLGCNVQVSGMHTSSQPASRYTPSGHGPIQVTQPFVDCKNDPKSKEPISLEISPMWTSVTEFGVSFSLAKLSGRGKAKGCPIRHCFFLSNVNHVGQAWGFDPFCSCTYLSQETYKMYLLCRRNLTQGGVLVESSQPEVPDNKSLGEWAGLCKIDKDQ